MDLPRLTVHYAVLKERLLKIDTLYKKGDSVTVPYVTHDDADDNEIEKRMQIRSTFENKSQNKILTPNGLLQWKDGDAERVEFPQFYK